MQVWEVSGTQSSEMDELQKIKLNSHETRANIKLKLMN